MQLHPRVTSATVDFAARFEGLRRRAARLPDGRGWTVGYGHSRTAREGAQVTEAEARALLAWDLSQAAAVVEAVVFAPLDANAFDALCDFAFNIGETAFRTCEVARHLNEGRPLRAAAAMEVWRRATIGGHSLVVDAVMRRRAAEKALSFVLFGALIAVVALPAGLQRATPRYTTERTRLERGRALLVK